MSALKQNTEKVLSEYERELRLFYIKAFISEFSKILIFLIVFLLLGLTKEYFISLVFLFLFRANSGGIHCKHYISCLMLSFFVLALNILLARNIYLTKHIMICICLIAGIICYKLTPIQAKTRPPATDDLIKKAKSSTLLISTSFVIVLILIPVSIITNMGFWMLVIHSIQLVIANKLKRR